MKQILLTLSLLLLGLLPAGAFKKFDVSPINLAIILVEKSDSASVASTLKYYGYTHQGTEDGYKIMKDSKGNELRYTFNDNNSYGKYPTIIVKNDGTHKDIDSKLKELNFEKVGHNYERVRNQYSKNKTQCGFGPDNTLIIRRVKN